MKKIYISADIEGIWGNAAGADTMRSGHEYEEYRTNMTNEVNLAIDALFAQGADEILVNDGHGNMDNLQPSRLDPRVSIVTSNGGFKEYGMMEGLDDRFSGVCLIGYHCRSNTHGVLAHTMWGTMIRHICVDGMEMGESGMNARLAWEYGVPVVLVSGDHGLAQQLQVELARPHAFVETKHAINNQCAISCSWNTLKERYHNAAKQAMTLAVPMKKESNSHLAEITFHRERQADFVSRMDHVERIDLCSVQVKAETYDELYRKMRFLIKVCDAF